MRIAIYPEARGHWRPRGPTLIPDRGGPGGGGGATMLIERTLTARGNDRIVPNRPFEIRTFAMRTLKMQTLKLDLLFGHSKFGHLKSRTLPHLDFKAACNTIQTCCVDK